MKSLIGLTILVFLVVGCTPNQVVSSPTVLSFPPTTTITPTSTEIPTTTPAPTYTPSPIPSPTLALPVGYQTPVPISNTQITLENIEDLREVARYYGDMLFTASLTKDQTILFIKDLLGIDIYDYKTKEMLYHISLFAPLRESSLQISTSGEWVLADSRWLIHVVLGDEPEIRDINSEFPLEEGNALRQISLSPDGHKFLIMESRCTSNGCVQRRFQIVNLPDMQIDYSWDGGYVDMHGQNPVFSPDGSLIAARVDYQIMVWKILDGTQVAVIKSIQGGSSALLSNDSSRIAIGQLNTVQIWDIASGEKTQTIKGLCGDLYYPPQPVYMDEEEIVILECSTVSVWTISDGEKIYENDFGPIILSNIVYRDKEIVLLENPRQVSPWMPPRRVYSIQFIDQGSLTFSQSDDWHRNIVTCIVDAGSHAECFENIILGTDNEFYKYLIQDNLVEFFPGLTQGGAPLYSLRLNRTSIDALDPVNGLLFYTKNARPNSSDSYVVNLENNESRNEWQNSFFEKVIFSENNKYAALCRKKHTFGISTTPGIDFLTFYDLSKKETIRQQSFTCYVPMTFTKDGGKLATVKVYNDIVGIDGRYGYRHELFLVDTLPPAENRTFDVGCDHINALAFNRDDSFLILACWDGTLRFLEPDTTAEIHRITNIDPDILGLAISKDGKRLAMASKRGYISIWAVPPFDFPIAQEIQPSTNTPAAIFTPAQTPTRAPTKNFTPTVTPSFSLQLVIEANRKWKNTEVLVKEGDSVLITYTSGRWRSSPDYSWVNGFQCKGTCDDCLLPTAPEGSLIARIGDGKAFCVASATTIRNMSGNLILSFNDCAGDWCFQDNEGSLTIQIDISSGS